MKFNWGTGIALGMAAFIAFIVTLSVKMMRQKVDLVAKDYYEQGIGYEKQIESIKAANALSQPITVQVNYTSKQLDIAMPSDFKGKKVEGTIILFRSADSGKDVTLTLSPDSTLHQYIPLEKMAPGNWRVKLQWQCEGKDYYHEEVVVI